MNHIRFMASHPSTGY